MIILYDKNEQEFTSLGIGVLKDASECVVAEELNGGYELEMEYPVTGAHYADIVEDRIIFTKPNDVDDPQPFRIYKVTRPIDGLVTVYAAHIAYDTANVPVKAVKANNLTELFQNIQNGQITNSRFRLVNEKETGTDISFITKHPYSLRALLLAQQGDSVINTYSGEFKFDKFDICLKERRGSDKGFTIRYSKNMTDIEQETNSDLMYTGVYPYYSNTTTESKTAITKKYKEVYISTDASSLEKYYDPITREEIFPSKWLSYSNNGIGLDSIVSLFAVNIVVSEGDYNNHIIKADKTTPLNSEMESTEQSGSYFYDVTYVQSYINKNAVSDFGEDWLYVDPELSRPVTKVEWNPYNLPTKDPGDGSEWWNPNAHKDAIYRIFTSGDKLYTTYVWQNGQFRTPTSEDSINEYLPQLPNVGTETEEKDNTIVYEGGIIFINEKRARVNEEVEEYTQDWLIEIKEKEQSSSTDPRWEDVSEQHTPINPEAEALVGFKYKVPFVEEPIRAYPDTNVKEGDPKWLYEDPELTTLLTPVDQQLYVVERSDGKDFYYRWSEYDQLYSVSIDTRYTYKNYIWNNETHLYELYNDTSNDKILTLDLSDKFSETPKNTSKFHKMIYEYAIAYITENKLGTLKNSIKVSFAKLSSDPEYSKWKDLEKVELGDTVHVIYNPLGINIQKRVIKTEYNVLTDRYDSIELGEESTSFTNNALTKGDSVSALTNDRNYADVTTVTKLVAERIEADYIKSMEAEITEAQIQTLSADSISAALIEAQRFCIDELVATLLVADDASIRNQLTVGDGLIVSGEINIKSGQISIVDDENISYVTAYINYDETITEYGQDWLKEHINDTEPLNIADTSKYPAGTIFKVFDRNNLWIQKYYVWDVEDQSYIVHTVESTTYFNVDEHGNVEANSLVINGGSISIQSEDGNTSFTVNADGELEANSVDLEGKITATSGDIGGCIIEGIPNEYTEAYVIEGAEEYSSGWLTDVEGGTTPLTPIRDAYYKVSIDYEDVYFVWNGYRYVDIKVGILQVDGLNVSGTLRSVTIEASEIILQNGEKNTSFTVNADGELEANAISLEGGTIENLNISGMLYFGDKYIRAFERTASLNSRNANWISLKDASSAPLTPDSSKVYYVVRSSPYVSGFYRWNQSTSGYVENEDSYYINQDGFKLFAIEATTDYTKIAGFTVEENTLYSRNGTKEVGITSDKDDIDNYAIWAGRRYSVTDTITAYIIDYEYSRRWLGSSTNPRDAYYPLSDTDAYYIVDGTSRQYYRWSNSNNKYISISQSEGQSLGATQAYVIDYKYTHKWLTDVEGSRDWLSADEDHIYSVTEDDITSYYEYDSANFRYIPRVDANSNFYVTHSGELYSRAGYIGGFEINADSLEATDVFQDHMKLNAQGIEVYAPPEYGNNGIIFPESLTYINSGIGIKSFVITVDYLHKATEDNPHGFGTQPFLSLTASTAADDDYVTVEEFDYEWDYQFIFTTRVTVEPTSETVIDLSANPKYLIKAVFATQSYTGTHYTGWNITTSYNNTTKEVRVYNNNDRVVAVDVMILLSKQFGTL